MAASLFIEGGTPTGLEWGVDESETALFLDNITLGASNPKELLRNRYNQPVGFAYNIDARRTLSVSGDTQLSSGGILAETYGTTATLSYDINPFFGSSGALFLDTVTQTQARGAWKTHSFNFEAFDLITSAT